MEKKKKLLYLFRTDDAASVRCMQASQEIACLRPVTNTLYTIHKADMAVIKCK